MSAPRVLVVEDDPNIRLVVAEFLSLHGYEVRSAEDGAVGLALAETWLPDLILLDLMMPVMDGWSFRGAQLERPALRTIPVVIITASYTPETDLSALCADRVLRKPLDFAELASVVAESIRPVARG